ncbi:Polynucleotide 5'-hydroxyl-kinase grc3 [Xylographa opegraphella]|nr:Polynucleotide 5'-hydroxyl-kinase grc3 [Xylographa opegraphella]
MSKGIESNGKPLSAIAARRAVQRPDTQPKVASETLHAEARENLSLHISSDNQKVHDTQRRPLKRKRNSNTTTTKIRAKEPQPASKEHVSKWVADKSLKKPVSNLEVSAAREEDVAPDSRESSTAKDGGSQISSLSSDLDYDPEEGSDLNDPVILKPKHFIRVPLSSFSSSDGNIVRSSTRECKIRLTDGDILTPVGQYDLWVRKGTVSILGAVLHPSPKLHRVYAPSSHSLPSIRHLRNPFGPAQQPAEISIYSCTSRIRLLRRVSRKFRRIWNHTNFTSDIEDTKDNFYGTSFSLLKDSSQDTLHRPLAPLAISSEWQDLILRMTDPNVRPSRVIMICGPKGAGKSTLTRLLTNEFVLKSPGGSGVCFLDLDPGQPEYSPPGDVSLVHLKSYNLGPPYTHPTIANGSENTPIRAHHVGGITPRDDPHHYTQCVLELYSTFRGLFQQQQPCPLVINMCGWIFGAGLDLLEELVRSMALTDVVYMSTTGPTDAVDTLSAAALSTGASFHVLPSQPSTSTSRTAADLRAMQTLSYFHLDEPERGILRWNAASINTVEPTNIYYSGPQQNILGVMILGNEMATTYLAALINGSVLGVVAIEDDSAIPADALAEYQHAIDDEATHNQDITEPLGSGDEDVAASRAKCPKWQPLDDRTARTARAPNPPAINPDLPTTSPHPKPSIRRSKEGIPYLFSGHGAYIPLDPSKTRCIGQVLIRGVDTRINALQAISPLPAATFASYREQGTKLVLVRGKLDMPTWAYEEECVEALAAQDERARWRKHRAADKVQDSDGYSGGSEWESDFDVEAWAKRQPWVSVAPKEKHRRDRAGRKRRD